MYVNLYLKASFDINDRPIRTAISKRRIPTSLQTELRGKHMNYIIISDELKNSVRKHIDSIPRIEHKQHENILLEDIHWRVNGETMFMSFTC